MIWYVASERFHVALGEVLARNLGVGVGDTIDAVLPQVAITPLGLLPRYRKLTVAAVVAVGASPDATLALTSLETARKLSRAADADGIRLQLSDPYRARELAQLIRLKSDGALTPVTWAETYQSLFAAIRMEKLMVSVLLSALIAVAAFSVISRSQCQWPRSARILPPAGAGLNARKHSGGVYAAWVIPGTTRDCCRSSTGARCDDQS